MSEEPSDQPARRASRTTHFAIYDPATGEIVRTGHGPAHVVERNVRAGEAILIGRQCDLLMDRIAPGPDGAPQVVRRPPAEIDARRQKATPPRPAMIDLLEALKAKGISLTPADLANARAARLQRPSIVRA